MFNTLFKKTSMQKNLGVEESVLDRDFDHMEELSDMEASSVVGGVGVDVNTGVDTGDKVSVVGKLFSFSQQKKGRLTLSIKTADDQLLVPYETADD